MQRLYNCWDSRLRTLRAEYDTAFRTWCLAKRELDQRTRAGVDNETLRCFIAILASAERQYVRKRNLLGALLAETRRVQPVPATGPDSGCALLARV